MKKKPAAPVYSSERGRLCPECGRPVSGCRCAAGADLPEEGGPVRVSRESKGRKGRGVTVISGLPLKETDLKILGRKLKKKCGSGGTVKSGTIEIQGDHRDLVLTELKNLGYAVKKSGG
ncbi:MAG: translation initiation factor Sui1 [Desulfohalobiaceae bacterium]|nr:translation initiation factor Sui1 [Desulfohalobiaceae bacterium]